jgi:hypothetical protein
VEQRIQYASMDDEDYSPYRNDQIWFVGWPREWIPLIYLRETSLESSSILKYLVWSVADYLMHMCQLPLMTRCYGLVLLVIRALPIWMLCTATSWEQLERYDARPFVGGRQKPGRNRWNGFPGIGPIHNNCNLLVCDIETTL